MSWFNAFLFLRFLCFKRQKVTKNGLAMTHPRDSNIQRNVLASELLVLCFWWKTVKGGMHNDGTTAKVTRVVTT